MVVHCTVFLLPDAHSSFAQSNEPEDSVCHASYRASYRAQTWLGNVLELLWNVGHEINGHGDDISLYIKCAINILSSSRFV